jgi:indoleamine 2,3-dioxygenase
MDWMKSLDVSSLATEGDRERALLLLTHFANAYVWSGDTPALVLPAPVAVPLCTLAEQMGRPPIAHYATTTLTNWRLVDPAQPLSVDNARTVIQFLGGVDEDWFFVASMGVELAGAPLLSVVADAVCHARDGTDAELAGSLNAFAGGMTAVHTALEQVRLWCDPATYYLRVRPFVTGWPQPGVVYEGVAAEPRRLIGGSAAQSALLQLFDAMLGVHHAEHPAGAYLRTVRTFMPPPHRAFVEDTERDSRVRERVQQGDAPLQKAYNAALRTIATFRDAHMRLAHDYVVAPSASGRDTAGTGGTALDTFLRGAHRSTSDARV